MLQTIFFLKKKRNIDKMRGVNDETKKLMKAIPYLETSEEVNNAFEILKKLKVKAVDGNFFSYLRCF